MRGSINRLRQIATLTTEYDQVPNQIRCCLELVRTCDHDLQHLIQLRNENAALLKQEPRAIERIDSIINAARSGLDHICKLVESCRPEAHNGKTPFRNKLRWVLIDSLDFQIEEPVLSRHHAAVLGELSYVRQVALAASSDKQKKPEEKGPVVDAQVPQVFENLALLGDIIGDLPVTSNAFPLFSVTPDRIPSPHVNVTYTQVNMEYFPSPQQTLPGRDKLNPGIEIHEMDSGPCSSASPRPVPLRTASTLAMPVYCDEKEVVPEVQQKPDGGGVVLGSAEGTGLSMLFDDISTPYLSPAPNTSSLASISQISLTSPVPSRYDVSPLGSIQTNSIPQIRQLVSEDEMVRELDGSHSSSIPYTSSATSLRARQQNKASLLPRPATLREESNIAIPSMAQRSEVRPHLGPFSPPGSYSTRGPSKIWPNPHITDVQDSSDHYEGSPVESNIQTARVEPLSTIPPELIYIHRKSPSLDSNHLNHNTLNLSPYGTNRRSAS